MRRSAWAVVAAVALALCGCAGGPAPPAGPAPSTSTAATSAPDGATFNATDVMFVQMMVPHHGQGIEIVRLAAAKTTRPELKVLAAAIETTQADEVRTMSGWLRDWRQPITAEPNAHAAHGGMPGTSDSEIATLRSATGADFERTFLNMMIAHQDDAIQVARMESGSGINPAARALAGRIEKSRAAQIRQMLAYLGSG